MSEYRKELEKYLTMPNAHINCAENTSMALTDALGIGGGPNIRIEIPQIDAHAVGSLLYFFERACGISGYILGVNPFDQPGVEAYKKNMFALLDKPGYEEASKAIKARL